MSPALVANLTRGRVLRGGQARCGQQAARQQAAAARRVRQRWIDHPITPSKKIFHCAPWRIQYWRLTWPGARARGDLAEGYHHGVGAVGPAQVGQVLELDVAAARAVEFGLQHGVHSASVLPLPEKSGV